MNRKTRKSGVQKTHILRDVLKEHKSISSVAEENQVAPQDIYRWEKQLFESAPEILASKAGRPKDESLLTKRIQELETKLKKKDEVIAELAADVILLKKNLGEI